MEEPTPREATVLGPVVTVDVRLAIRHLQRPKAWRAPVFVQDSADWPEPASEQTHWVTMPVREGKEALRTPLRAVQLWGKRVLVDDHRQVFCPRCQQLVPVVELGRDLHRGADGITGGGLPRHELAMPALPEGAA